MADPVPEPKPEPKPEVEPEVGNADEAGIQVGSDFTDDSDADSSYSWDDDSSSTQSLYSAITRHVYDNGRRYHSYRQGAYW
jgi:hypothetical protein